MEELFNTLIGFLPIAAIIAIRIFAGMQKNQRRSASPPRPEIFEEKEEKEEESFRPHWEESASSASPFPRKVPVPKPWERTWIPEPDAGERSAAGERPVFPGEVPGPAKAPPPAETYASQMGAWNSAPEFSAGKKSPADAKAARTAARPFSWNLESYPPLQRAIILAEILGPPRG
jgi:hypothetical protein